MAEEAIKQQNIEDIAQKSLPALKEEARPEDIENDWIANFFDKCRLISDTEMQDLWARVLAGEANAPGHSSKRTVNLLASFDKIDAELFQNLCSFCWSLNESVLALIFDYDNQVYGSRGINFGTLTHLDAIGLIWFDSGINLGGTGIHMKGLDQLALACYQDEFVIEFPNPSGNTLQIGRVMLTKAGEELLSVSRPTKSAGFQEYILERWRAQRVTIRSK